METRRVTKFHRGRAEAETVMVDAGSGESMFLTRSVGQEDFREDGAGLSKSQGEELAGWREFQGRGSRSVTLFTPLPWRARAAIQGRGCGERGCCGR